MNIEVTLPVDMNKIFYVRMRHLVNNVIYKFPVLATSYAEALEKARDYPYNTFGDYVVINEERIQP